MHCLIWIHYFCDLYLEFRMYQWDSVRDCISFHQAKSRVENKALYSTVFLFSSVKTRYGECIYYNFCVSNDDICYSSLCAKNKIKKSISTSAKGCEAMDFLLHVAVCCE